MTILITERLPVCGELKLKIFIVLGIVSGKPYVLY
jgi:hypothetical protein